MSDTRAITIQHMIAAWNSLPEQYGVEQRMGAAMNVAVAEEEAARHADLGVLMEATGVVNDGISPPAELFKRCLAQLAKARADEEIGAPVDPHFKTTMRDLDALRKDYKDHFDPEIRDGLPVTVHVARAVLYMTWPNEQYKPDDGSDPYRCISFHIPKTRSLAHGGDA